MVPWLLRSIVGHLASPSGIAVRLGAAECPATRNRRGAAAKEKVGEIIIKLLNVVQAAAELGLAKQTIYNWVSLGKLRTMKIGSSVRIPATEIERVRRWRRRPVAPRRKRVYG